METRIDGHTVMLGLFGSPVGHSGSPAMYNYSFKRVGINAAYLAFNIKADEMSNALNKMRLLNMRGANVTMPCKKVAANLVDELSPAAELVGAVNTIVNNGGILRGYNTDGAGYVENLRYHGIEPKGKQLTILGAGGAGTAIAVQMALDVAEAIYIFNPKDVFYQNAELTAQRIMEKVPSCQVTVNDINDKTALKEAITKSDILANATKIGMAPNIDQTNIEDMSLFRSNLIVTDTVYNPQITRMLADAAEHGSQIIDGKGMLVWQGAAAFKLYSGKEMPVEEVIQQFFSDDGGH
ncbi:shikimate dehydrogenase [Pediococcus pentosaceus]|uniref:Shikimate dehydrogenase (NADP(+)) n=1 Tax=Pediococcus pentosaceus TaxID=1255 RepID=A0AB73HED3_PEDPE|nr:shikimate dehydrogenase [Pediococcus pentosaceus]MBF7114420.1 shikimate dehydrogenase [Pediococcus pentosaceus]MDN3206835.1 shikimate dehydrogenase [Pediococcus pentosaceus]